MNSRGYNFKDITGMKFGELTAICVDEDKSKKSTIGTYWKCKCSCGAEKSIWGTNLRRGNTTTCGNNAVHWAGKNNSNWKGGKTAKSELERNSNKYKQWRQSVYRLDQYTCQCCLKNKKIKKEAHHMYNFSEHDKYKYDTDYGILLCHDCHSFCEVNSFHSIYGVRNNNPEQLEEYINKKRKQLGILIPFNIKEYIKHKKTIKLYNWLNLINSDDMDNEFNELLN